MPLRQRFKTSELSSFLALVRRLSLGFDFPRSSKAKSRIFKKCHSVAIIVISI